MSKDVLVIGGNIAGLQAALDLADAGIKVHLIESSPFFENGITKNLPQHLLHVRQLEIAKHPNITVKTNTRLDQVARIKKDFRVELQQHPRFIDLSKCTACGDCIEACPVTLPGSEHKAIYLDGQPGCVAIEKAGKSPCAHTCPAGIHVQGYVALIAQKRYEEAIDLIHKAMPFASVCGRVCNHTCEANCTRAGVDEPVNIMALKRFVADWEFSNWDPENLTSTSEARKEPTGKRVAIIGAGPAGLTAARNLSHLGHKVTVFDALPVAGGMMRVGIPAHRLPYELLDWEIERILDEGIDLKLNTRIDDLTVLLKDGYDAVLIATGATAAKKLPLDHADHPDNWLSLDLLRRTSLNEEIDLSGKRVLVVGGGNVALDSARTVIRLGASEVRMACLESRDQMPGHDWEIAVTEEEGIEVCPGRTFKEVVVENDQIVGMRCVEVIFRGFKNGRPDIDEIPDSEHVLPADIVVWAIGQGADLSFLPEDVNPKISNSPVIEGVSDLMTSHSGVFIAGDARRGMTTFVVDAIGEGHKAAASIDHYLRGEEYTAGDPGEAVQYDKKEIKIKHSQASQQERVKIASIPISERVHNFREVDLAITESQAISEAQRCLICGPCSECQACVEVCEPGAISHEAQRTYAALQVGAIICTDKSVSKKLKSFSENQGVYNVAPKQPVLASVAAANVMAGIGAIPSEKKPVTIVPVPTQKDLRIGAFICECGGHISSIIDTESVREQIADLPNVVYTQVLPFSCSQEAAETIQSYVKEHRLDRAVLAACSCCSTDQACFSCTYQRFRSRQNLGVLPSPDGHFLDQDTKRFEFINIREQCAWVHADDPQKATAKALALTSAAVSRARGGTDTTNGSPSIERSVLILGSGKAASIAREMLKKQGVRVERVRGFPSEIQRSEGSYLAVRKDHRWEGEALIIAPADKSEAKRLLDSFGGNGLRPRMRLEWGGISTHRPGIFLCDTGLDSELSGRAAAARATAWLGKIEHQIHHSAKVDPARCRACGTCVDLCEFGAPELTGKTPERTAWIDPVICTDCGTCAAHCPSGAIYLECPPEALLESMLSMVVAGED